MPRLTRLSSLQRPTGPPFGDLPTPSHEKPGYSKGANATDQYSWPSCKQGHSEGFGVKFLQVQGPDIIQPVAPPSRSTSSCDSLLIIAAGRETENFSTSSRARLRGYGPWEKLELGGSADDIGLAGTWLFKAIGQPINCCVG